MIKQFSTIILSAVCLIMAHNVCAQEVEPSPFDFGKMWTFENPPKEWFKEAYDFAPEDEWFDDVRMSSLRFASWCSASFVSAEGLIMTNHHCSRDVVAALQKEGENFDKQGFYAKKLSDERKADGLFVEQLVKAVNITDQVMDYASSLEDVEFEAAKQTALDSIKAKYERNSEWEGLRTQMVTYYSGGKYSLYGYKRYDDIRLVLIPELDLGFYGGDPDNFTYPRYNLDATFWRAYDDEGNPLNTSAHYLKFNPEGAAEGEATFVVGNPGSTERYRTVDQLTWDRDYRYKMQLRFMNNRHDRMLAEYNSIKDDPAKEFEAQELLSTIANIANGIKAITGIVGGMHNPELFNRKIAMESLIKEKTGSTEYWDEMSSAYKKLESHTWAMMHLGPSGLRGNVLRTLHDIAQYEGQLKSGAEDSELTSTREKITGMVDGLWEKEQVELFSLLLSELEADIYEGDNSLATILSGRSIDDYIADVMSNTAFSNKEKAEALLSDTDNIAASTDPMLLASRILIPKYKAAVGAFQSSSPARRGLEQKIANAAFQVYGDNLPPDATFTLRISDGVVKGYDYNGTTAPPFTTYYGMYDRHYSHGEIFPWSLPKRWMKPNHDLLKSPLNFVSTNDITGGNSGSPMINKNKECVGLIFDGNIESLPGNFIFDEEYNRTVSVHAGGIMAALKYIYDADRIVKELEK